MFVVLFLLAALLSGGEAIRFYASETSGVAACTGDQYIIPFSYRLGYLENVERHQWFHRNIFEKEYHMISNAKRNSQSTYRLLNKTMGWRLFGNAGVYKKSATLFDWGTVMVHLYVSIKSEAGLKMYLIERAVPLNISIPIIAANKTLVLELGPMGHYCEDSKKWGIEFICGPIASKGTPIMRFPAIKMINPTQTEKKLMNDDTDPDSGVYRYYWDADTIMPGTYQCMGLDENLCKFDVDPNSGKLTISYMDIKTRLLEGQKERNQGLLDKLIDHMENEDYPQKIADETKKSNDRVKADNDADEAAHKREMDRLRDKLDKLKKKIAARFNRVVFSVGLTEPVKGITSKIVFKAVELNANNAYDPKTGVFTAPYSGIYVFSLRVGPQSFMYGDLKLMKGGIETLCYINNALIGDMSGCHIIVALLVGTQVWVDSVEVETGLKVKGVCKNYCTTFGGFLLY